MKYSLFFFTFKTVIIDSKKVVLSLKSIVLSIQTAKYVDYKNSFFIEFCFLY